MTDTEIVWRMGKELGFRCTFYDSQEEWKKNCCDTGSVGGDFPLWEDDIGIHALCVNERVKKLRFYDSKDDWMPYIPETIGSLTELKGLYSTASFKTLPETIGNCTLLEVLDVGCSIQELPDVVCTLSKLEELQLAFSPITKLPEDIGNLKALKMVNLCGTSISKLPESIVNCTSMERMYTYYMSLTELPEDIGKLSNLRVLWVQQTRLSKLPESIGKCSKLEELHTGGIEIPDSLCKCRLLKELVIGSKVGLPKGIEENPGIKIVNGWCVAVSTNGGDYEYV